MPLRRACLPHTLSGTFRRLFAARPAYSAIPATGPQSVESGRVTRKA